MPLRTALAVAALCLIPLPTVGQGNVCACEGLTVTDTVTGPAVLVRIKR